VRLQSCETGDGPRADGRRALRCRRRRDAQPDPAATRDRDARARQLLREHHDLLSRRCAGADRGAEPQRRVRLRAASAGVLPLLTRRPGRIPRGQLGVDQNGELSRQLWDDTSAEKCVEYVREALGAPAELPIEIAAQLASAFHFWTFSRRRRGTQSSPRRGRTARLRRGGGAAAVHRPGRRGRRTRTSSRPIRRP
jgi:hypothetical protein